MAIGMASRVESYRCSKVSLYMSLLPREPCPHRGIPVIMQGYQNVRAVCSAHYEPAGARSKRAFSIPPECVHFSMEVQTAWCFSLAWISIPFERSLVREEPYFDPGQGVPLITRRFFTQSSGTQIYAHSDHVNSFIRNNVSDILCYLQRFVGAISHYKSLSLIFLFQ